MSEPKPVGPTCQPSARLTERMYDRILAADQPGDRETIVSSLIAERGRQCEKYKNDVFFRSCEQLKSRLDEIDPLTREGLEAEYDGTVCRLAERGLLLNYQSPDRPLRLAPALLYKSQLAFIRLRRYEEDPVFTDPPRASLTIGAHKIPADEVRIGRDPSGRTSGVPHVWFPLKGIKHEGHQVYVKVASTSRAISLFAQFDYKVDGIHVETN